MARTRILLACAAATLVAACATTPPSSPPRSTVSVARLYEQPAERAFLNAMRLYEEGEHERAETQFRRALSDGLKDPHDVAMANKHLAFIACAYNRPVDCENHKGRFRRVTDKQHADDIIGGVLLAQCLPSVFPSQETVP